MKIELMIDGKLQEFHTMPTARSTRRAYETRMILRDRLQQRAKEKDPVLYTPDIVDALTAWVVEAWGNKFTADQYLDGYQGPFTDAFDMMDAQINMVLEGLAAFPNPKAWAPPETVETR